MANGYSVDDLLEFLGHAGDKGLMPAATASALAVATRTVLAVLDGAERDDVRRLDLAGVIKRFTNKRAKDFSQSSLKEYARRVHRAIELFVGWREDPANFTIKTRATPVGRKKDRSSRDETVADAADPKGAWAAAPQTEGSYQSSFLIRPGVVVTLVNVPTDLTAAEVKRLTKFVEMLAVE